MTILSDIKVACGVIPANLGFDPELLQIINSVKSAAVQIGVTEYASVVIDDTTEWVPLSNSTLDGMAKEYLALRTRIIFDPIASESIRNSMTETIQELEGRIGHEVDEVQDAEV